MNFNRSASSVTLSSPSVVSAPSEPTLADLTYLDDSDVFSDKVRLIRERDDRICITVTIIKS